MPAPKRAQIVEPRFLKAFRCLFQRELAFAVPTFQRAWQVAHISDGSITPERIDHFKSWGGLRSIEGHPPKLGYTCCNQNIEENTLAYEIHRISTSVSLVFAQCSGCNKY